MRRDYGQAMADSAADLDVYEAPTSALVGLVLETAGVVAMAVGLRRSRPDMQRAGFALVAAALLVQVVGTLVWLCGGEP